MSLAADLIVFNANVLTQSDRQPIVQAFAVRRGIIEAAGSNQQIESLAGPSTRRLDAQHKTITPGFIDCHLHLLWFGRQHTLEVDLVGSQSVDEILDRLNTFARTTDGWIVAHGFDQEKLRERRFPLRDELDRVSKSRPIIMSRICGHAVVGNTAAIAALTDDQRRAGDANTGLYTESAGWAFYRHRPPPDATQLKRALQAACGLALQTGFTSLQTLLDNPEQLEVYTRLKRSTGRLPVRILAMPPERSVDTLHAHGILTGFGDDFLRVGNAKFFSDGSFGARTALLSTPYHDDPTKLGDRIYPDRTLHERCRAVFEKGFSIAIHAIGDQALRESIDAIEFALDGASNDEHRCRIEHAALASPDLVDRLARLKIQTTVQPQFVTSDTWTPQRIGPHRVPWAYPFASMLRAGVPIGLSSDCPVERLSSFECLKSVCARHEWTPQETLTIEQALKAYTMGSAACGKMEHIVGSIEVGKKADFVVLSEDPRTVPAPELNRLRAERVFVDGSEAGGTGYQPV